MEYIELDGRLYELTVLSEAQGDEVSIECFDLSPADGDLVGVLRVEASGRARITLFRDVPVELLRRWLRFAESAGGLSDSTA